MKFIQNRITDPYFNLALEEFLLRHVPYESCMLWQSRASVVIGKHQNALAEVNVPFVWGENIPVIRRLSGGGTVFHGSGNLNFTLIREGESGKLIDFKKHTQPVIAFLNNLGIPARFEGKNDLRVHGLKISGNAEHVLKNRVLHHGTLLFDSDLKQLNEAISVRPGRYVDKSVQSVRSRVANVSDFLPEPISFGDFKSKLELYLKSFFQQELQKKGRDFDISDHHLSDEQIGTVREIAREKYTTWEWNYGYSPDYTFSGYSEMAHGVLKSKLFVRKGVVEEAFCEYVSSGSPWTLLASDLKGKQHRPDVILELLKKYSLVEKDVEQIPINFITLFF